MSEISIQLYTVRERLKQDFRGTLAELSRIGYSTVEPFSLVKHAQQLREVLPEFGMSATTSHMRLIGSDLTEVFDAAQVVGVQTIIDPKVDPSRWRTRESLQELAQEFRAIAEQAADRGLRVGYHNHAFELETRIGSDSALEIFAGLVGEDVDLEVDTYWAEVGGANAPDLLRRLGEQVTAIHLKDGPRTTRNKDQVALGQGKMLIEEICASAPHALYVVELDDSDDDLMHALDKSISYLNILSLSSGKER